MIILERQVILKSHIKSNLNKDIKLTGPKYSSIKTSEATIVSVGVGTMVFVHCLTFEPPEERLL